MAQAGKVIAVTDTPLTDAYGERPMDDCLCVITDKQSKALAKVLNGWSELAKDLERQLAAATARAEAAEDALMQIDQWAKAYPLAVFPEPDFKAVAKALSDAGLSLDAVSASNMRHVVAGVGEIARKAIDAAQGSKP